MTQFQVARAEPTAKNRFKVGDRVTPAKPAFGLKMGCVYVVTAAHGNNGWPAVEIENKRGFFWELRFILASEVGVAGAAETAVPAPLRGNEEERGWLEKSIAEIYDQVCNTNHDDVMEYVPPPAAPALSLPNALVVADFPSMRGAPKLWGAGYDD